jgi:hypothetical protein
MPRALHPRCVYGALTALAAAALLLVGNEMGVVVPPVRLAFPAPVRPLPSPPDAARRLQELASYRMGACTEPVAPVSDAAFVVVVMVRGEAAYIEEWVMYHLFIGVDLIYLYDNEDTPTYHRMFACNPRVVVMHFPWTPGMPYGVHMMTNEHYFKHYNARHTWALIFDADEFLVLWEDWDVKQFAARAMVPGVDAVAVQWLLFGHNSHVNATDEPVIVRFTRRDGTLQRYIKTVFRCTSVTAQLHPHFPVYAHPGAKVVLAAQSGPLPWQQMHNPKRARAPQASRGTATAAAAIFHYITKSVEEGVARRQFRQPPHVADPQGRPTFTPAQREERRR